MPAWPSPLPGRPGTVTGQVRPGIRTGQHRTQRPMRQSALSLSRLSLSSAGLCRLPHRALSLLPLTRSLQYPDPDPVGDCRC
ncbi:hypothetical protein FCM35_KLT09000 [Carex littledalei]|uniref:Uncharacterized protein n=1 Tax=Carex littledalei TaxID=544730 RepID=A0A833VH24_9POAL|nr:hypothetical protein FCM35_KLT09000 [Carex littledalei]